MEGLVPPVSDGIPRVPPYSRTTPPAVRSSPTGVSPSALARPRDPSADPTVVMWRCTRAPRMLAQPPPDIGRVTTQSAGFGLSPFRSPLLRTSRLIPFPRGTEMFQFPRFPTCVSLPSTQVDAPSQSAGLPHSDTHGSARLAAPRGVSSPAHVLLRPDTPRHPPSASLPSPITHPSWSAPEGADTRRWR